MKLLNIVVLLLAMVTSMAAANPTLDLRKLKGWTVVVPAEALPSEKYAAEEFQSLFDQVTSIRLPIASAPPTPTRNIFIGPSTSLDSSTVAVAVNDLGDEGLRIRIDLDNIAIAGGRPRGTLLSLSRHFEKKAAVSNHVT